MLIQSNHQIQYDVNIVIAILILYYFGDYFEIALLIIYQAVPILERKDIHKIFSKNRGERQKRAKYLKI